MKTTVTITLDIEIIAEIKKREVNLSGLINDFLKEFVTLPQASKDSNKTELTEALAKLKQKEIEKAEWEEEWKGVRIKDGKRYVDGKREEIRA